MVEETFRDRILYLKDQLGSFHIMLPVTQETLIAIEEKAEHLEKIKKHGAEPESIDSICSYHLSTFGW